ncbi:hypothetical protein, partial [Ruminiclostridium hungatei]|uniref:hypothetical protein n=1 Tax=Ruminiclostridium hungatei TaxID=48256 RepID=UPI001056496D
MRKHNISRLFFNLYSYDNNGNTISKTVEAAGNMGAAEVKAELKAEAKVRAEGEVGTEAGEASNQEYMPGTGSLAIQGQTTEADISAIGAAEEITSAGTDSIETDSAASTETALSGTTSTEKASLEIIPMTTLDTTTEQALSLEAQA